MPRLTDFQYHRLLKPQLITIECGPDKELKEQIPVHMGFAAYSSEFLAGLISKPGFEGTINLGNVGTASAKLFTRWCYQGRLEPPTLSKKQPQQASVWKAQLIDLWLFSGMHVVPRLQNDAMEQLRAVFSHNLNLLTMEDVRYVFGATRDDNPLRDLMVLVLVVKVDTGNEKFEDYDALAQEFPGFFGLFFKYQRTWLLSNGKAKQKSQKLGEILQDEEFVGQLKVKVTAPPEWVLVLSGAKPKPIAPGEIIELD